MKSKIISLINDLIQNKKNIINPDYLSNTTKSWIELGFDKQPEEYENIEEFLEYDIDGILTGEDQVLIKLINEVIERLKQALEIA